MRIGPPSPGRSYVTRAVVRSLVRHGRAGALPSAASGGNGQLSGKGASGGADINAERVAEGGEGDFTSVFEFPLLIFGPVYGHGFARQRRRKRGGFGNARH